MNSHDHNAISIGFGSFLSIFTYIAENPYIHDGDQLVKVIVFGLLGGAFGYFGKILAMRIHRFFKK